MQELADRLEPELPGALEKIRRSLRDESFQDMCLEYEDGVKCLRRFAEGQRRRMAEVAELVEGVQQEILHYLRSLSRV